VRLTRRGPLLDLTWEHTSTRANAARTNEREAGFWPPAISSGEGWNGQAVVLFVHTKNKKVIRGGKGGKERKGFTFRKREQRQEKPGPVVHRDRGAFAARIWHLVRFFIEAACPPPPGVPHQLLEAPNGQLPVGCH